MLKENLFKHRILAPVIAGFAVGILLLVYNSSSTLIVIFVCVLPILFYLFHRSFATILKLMLLVVFFVPFQYYDFLNPFKVFNPLVILGLIMAVKLLHKMKREKQAKALQITVIDRLYFVFFISVLISSSRAISLLGSLNWLFYSVTTGYVVYRVILTLTQEEIKGLLKFLVLVSCLSAVYGIGEFLVGYSLIFGTSISGRLTSLLGHPLLNGLIFSTILPINLLLYFQTRRKWFILSSLILFTAIILTFARGSWLAIIISVLMIGIFHPNIRINKTPWIILAFFIVIMAIPATNKMVINRIMENERYRYSSFNIRLKSIPITLDIIRDRPFFGGGPFNAGRYKEIYSTDLALRSTSYENTYLGLFVDLGFIGVSLLALIIFLALKNSFLRRAININNYIFKIAVSFSLFILLINMATFSFDAYRLFHFISWFFISLNFIAFKIGKDSPV